MLKSKKMLFVTLATITPILATMSCFSVSVSDSESVKNANVEQMRINNQSHPTHEHLVIADASIIDGTHFSDEITNKILEAVGITKNASADYGYRIFPQEIVKPTTTSGGSFKADIRAYYKETVNEATQGIGYGTTKDNRVVVYYENFEANVIQSDVNVAVKNIKGTSYNNTAGAENILNSTKTFEAAVVDSNWGGNPKPTTPRVLTQAEFGLLGLSQVTNGNTNIFPYLSGNLMGTTVQYVFDREATPKPSLTIIVKKGTGLTAKTANIKYDIAFAGATL